MSRSLKACLLIAALLWQSLVWVTPFGVQTQGEDLGHRLLHMTSEAGTGVQPDQHHHHEDASLELSSDKHSEVHFHADSGFQPVALTSLASTKNQAISACAPAAMHPSEPATVYLDGLLRPPSAA